MRSVDRQAHRSDAAGQGKAGQGPVAGIQLQEWTKTTRKGRGEFFHASRQVTIFFLVSSVGRAVVALCRLPTAAAGCELGPVAIRQDDSDRLTVCHR